MPGRTIEESQLATTVARARFSAPNKAHPATMSKRSLCFAGIGNDLSSFATGVHLGLEILSQDARVQWFPSSEQAMLRVLKAHKLFLTLLSTSRDAAVTFASCWPEELWCPQGQRNWHSIRTDFADLVPGCEGKEQGSCWGFY